MASMPDTVDRDSRDALTGLGDVQQLRRTIANWCAEWPDDSGPCPIHAMLITLGRMETVNVAFGENAGDGALVEVAQRIRHFAADELESTAWLATRLSGSSFMLISMGECSRERWQWLAEALADALAAPIANPDGGSSLRLWPRISLMRSGENDNADSILDRLAEVASRMRMSHGRRIDWSSGVVDASPRSNIELEADLLAAIDRDEIEILFQPQYSLVDDRIVGAEALARWHHPVVGQISASTLFQIAERADHIAQLSRHIARRALEHATRWPANMKLSLNITPTDLAAENFAIEFARLAEKIGFSLNRITLEITEQVLLADLERVGRVLQQLKVLDVTIALDDFGAGFCNFRYLKVLPIDCIKLDRSMVEGVLEDERDRAIFRAIMGMAKALDLRVLVEGIETERQRDFCAAEDCEFYQGFLRAEPMTPHAFVNLASR
ncbi:GGDEF domain-containing phosphodiesterase [Qipengyuania gelatinilytica]|uniref:GGDEF domain-containing phosphodiesterase n=2 Tax=Qipengyuania gelatinilytica TaxID=2867231 RepID=A0ABX9A217_9SPHN|nr:GGDEF domain-containing phosphodiesterase [Qipengyuania gelatinilytica]